MRKTLTAILTVALLTLSLAPMAMAGPIHLSYSNFFPPSHIQSKLAEEWGKEVEKRTNGAVVIDYYPGSTLVKPKQCFDGVIDGIADIGMSAPAYSRGRFPLMEAVDLPLGYTSGVQATNVANAVYKEFKPHELDDVQTMYFHAHGPGLLFTIDTPVTKLADLKGLKIRSTGNSAKLIKALGGTPVAQSMPSCYQSLQKGVVDGSIHPMESNKGWNLAEVVKFGTESFPVAYTTSFYVVMNKDKWDSLDAKTQAIITEINEEWAVKHGQAWDEADKEGLAFFTEKGGKMLSLSDDESKAWVEAAKPVFNEYHEASAGKGFDSHKLIDFMHSVMNK